jgi:O-antigen ligase
VLFGLAWLLPGHFRPWGSFQQEPLAAIGAVLLAAAALVTLGKTRIAPPAAACFAVALAVVPLLQWSAGRIPYIADALLPALYLLAFALVSTAGRALAVSNSARLLAILFAAFMVAAVASTGIAFAQAFNLGQIAHVELLHGGRAYGNLVQPNHLASLLGLGFVGFVWAFEKRRLGALATTLACAFIGMGIVMSQSRSSWLVLAVLVLWWFMMRRRLAFRLPAGAVALGVASFALATVFWALFSLALDHAGTAVSDGLRTDAGTRPIHWATLWDAAWRRPWLGWGWHQVSIAQQAAALDHAASHEWVTFSHNALLDLMVWNGAVPGLLLSALIAWWAWRRIARCAGVDAWALLAAAGVLVAHSIVEFPLAYLYFLLPFAVIIGALDALEAGNEALARARVPRWVFASVLLGLAGALGMIWAEYLKVEDAYREVSFREAGVVMQGSQGPQVPDVTLLDNQREFIWFRMTHAKPGMDENTLDRLKTLSQRFAPPAAMLRYALAAGLNGRKADAERNLRLICHMWPARNCDEGRASWALLQKQYPQLNDIGFPSVPPRATSKPRT